ncbi:MAG: NAD-binding protein [Clostridia bacterium]|nr:NAD-binding protein [Clostridia bacterium]
MKVIIVGGGQVGTYIANLLLKSNCTVRVIENREHVLEKIKKDLPADVVVQGSGTDPAILELCGIAQADVVAAVTGSDKTNLVASTIAKFEFDVPRVIARVNNPQNAWLFNGGMGVDVALNQADLMAHLVVEEIDLKNMLTLMKLNRGNYSIVKVTVDKHSKIVNKAVKDVMIPDKAVLIAISRGSEIIIPRGDTVFLGEDKIFVFAANKVQGILNDMFGQIEK